MISQVDTIKYRGVLVAKNLLSGDQEILMKQNTCHALLRNTQPSKENGKLMVIIVMSVIIDVYKKIWLPNYLPFLRGKCCNSANFVFF